MNTRVPTLSLVIGSERSLDVRQFEVSERISKLFSARIVAVSRDDALDFDALAGQPALFEILGATGDMPRRRRWAGICRQVELIEVEDAGLSTYAVEIVPTLWLTTQRINHRVFQHLSDVDVAVRVLGDWNITPELRLSAAYKKRKYRVQYGESDFDFASRLLEDAGVSFFFEDRDDGSQLVLCDAPHAASRRAPPIAFKGRPTDVDLEHVTRARLTRQLRPGRLVLRDHDYRRPPTHRTLGEAATGSSPEQLLERYHYVPGAFLVEAEGGEPTPHADDKGRYRVDWDEGGRIAARWLDAHRGDARTLAFESNVIDLAPGAVIAIAEHPRAEVAGADQLVTTVSIAGEVGVGCTVQCEARPADRPYRPALATPKPRVMGHESATVVGPPGEEIHTDEFGRVRVQFHWDRDGRMDDNSSCWIHVSQPWSGAGFGGVNLPRVGQEVLVSFLCGDPDRPVIVGRVYNNLQKIPYELPENKTQSAWKSNSTNATGGYNEIMFEDKAGDELVRIQAERDLDMLVKHDESVTVRNDLTKLVGANEREETGQNRTSAVGVNWTSQIGMVQRVIAGEMIREAVPQRGGSDGKCASITITDRKIVLDTGAGATITLDVDKIILDAHDYIDLRGRKKGIDLSAPAGSIKQNTGTSFVVDTTTISMVGSTVTIAGDKLGLGGNSSAELTSSGPTTVSGTPVQLNGPGLFASRITETTIGSAPFCPDTIATGAALVVIGGASFPLPVTRDGDDLKIGKNITLKKGGETYPDFQNRVLRDLGILASTPSGRQRLENIENNPGGHKVTIEEYTKADAESKDSNGNPLGPDNSFAAPGVAQGDPGALHYDADGKPFPGPGVDSQVHYNPDIKGGPKGFPDEPADGTLFHELGHAEHDVYGTNRQFESLEKDPALNGYENREEWQNIDGGVNEPGGTQVPGVPKSPSENDYLRDRHYPAVRTDHGDGWKRADDGTPIQ